MDEALSVDSELLSAQLGWVRELARGLVADVHLADDVAQEALVAALERPPRGGRDATAMNQGRLRAWLGGVVRNRLKMNARGASSRRTREQAAARPEAQVEDRIQDRAARARMLVEEVMALEEPYRSAVLLRYYESLGVVEIARQTGVSPGAVRTRLSRALDRLRESIDRRHDGDRTAWALAFARWSREAPGAPATAVLTAGGILVTVKIAALLAASALLVTAVSLRVGFDEPAPAFVPGPGQPDLVERSPAPIAQARAQTGRSPVDTPPSTVALGHTTAQGAAVPAPPCATVRGRITGEGGRGIAGAAVCVQPHWAPDDVERARADPDGHYEVTLDRLPVASPHVLSQPQVTVLATAPGYQQGDGNGELWINPLTIHIPTTVDLELSAGFEWIGRVVDAEGQPAQAQVLLHELGGGSFRRGRGDGSGGFRVPLPPDGRAMVTAGSVEHGFASYGPFEIEPGRDHQAGTIALVSPGTLEGVVLGPGGTRSAGVTVRAYPLDAPPVTVLEPGLPRPDAGWWDSPPAPRRFDTYWELAGLPWGQVQANARGRFTFRGLLPGRYELVTLPLGGGEGKRHGRFDTGQWAELTEDRYLLTGRVTDAAGLPACAEYSIFIEATGDVIEAQTSGHEATFAQTVQPGTVWLVVWHPPARPVVQRLDVLPGAYGLHTDVVLDFEAPRGALELDVIDGSGLPVEEFQAQILAVLPDTVPVPPRASMGGLLRQSPRMELPAGEYRVQVRESDGLRGLLLPEETTFVLEAGQTRQLEVRLRAGSRFRMQLHLPSAPGTSPARRATVRVQTPDGDLRELHFVRHEGGGGRVGKYSFSAQAELSSLLDPGPHVVFIETPGFEPVERVLQLAPGEVSELELTLVPR